MTNSSITLVFSADASNGDVVQFSRLNSGIKIPISIEFTSSSVASAIGLAPLGTPTGTAGEMTAEVFAQYFEKYYNYTNIFTVSQVSNQVVIEIDGAFTFVDYFSDAPVSEVIVAGGPQIFTATSSIVAYAPDLCNFFDLDIIASENIVEYRIGSTAPVPITPSTTLTLTLPRVFPQFVFIYDLGGDYVRIPADTTKRLYVRKVYSDNINVEVTPNMFEGATVTIDVSFPNQWEGYPYNLSLQYSLDGVLYQTSNVFTGQSNGNYTAYVKDDFGCVTTTPFVVSGSGSRNKYFLIPKLNSVTFSKNEVYDPYSASPIYPNDTNTLSLTEKTNLNYLETLLFSENDLLRIQFKSNFENHVVEIEECEDGTWVDRYTLSAGLMSNNLNRFQSLDAWLYSYSTNMIGIYFTSGNTYNESDVPNGAFTLNGNLPDFAKIGQYINIGGGFGTKLIRDIVYDVNIEKYAIIVKHISSPIVTQTQIVKAYFDLLNFEVYEFDVDFTLIPPRPGHDRLFRLRIDALDGAYDNESHYSEAIALQRDLSDTVAIQYWNTNNRDIFYLYGITHFFRTPIINIQAHFKDDSEIHESDITNSIISTEVSDGNEFIFDVVTRNTLTKLVLALSSEKVYINGEGYVKDGGIDISNIEGTNLYEVKAKMIKTNKILSNLVEEYTGQAASTNRDFVYIPQVLSTGAGLLKL